jgi:hypothetical protein
MDWPLQHLIHPLSFDVEFLPNPCTVATVTISSLLPPTYIYNIENLPLNIHASYFTFSPDVATCIKLYLIKSINIILF